MAGGAAHSLSKFRPAGYQGAPRPFKKYRLPWEEDKYLDPKYRNTLLRQTKMYPFYFFNYHQYKLFRFPTIHHVKPEEYYYGRRMAKLNGTGQVRLINNLQAFRAFGKKPLSIIEREYCYGSALKPLYKMPMFMPVIFDVGRDPMPSDAFQAHRNQYKPGVEPITQIGSSYDFYDYQEKEKGALCFYRVGYENFLMLEKAKKDLGSKKSISAMDKVIAETNINTLSIKVPFKPFTPALKVLVPFLDINPELDLSKRRYTYFLATMDLMYYVIKMVFDYTKVPYVPYVLSRQFRRLAGQCQNHSESHIAFDILLQESDFHQAICGYYGISGFGSDKAVLARLESYSKALIAEDKFFYENEYALDECSKEQILEMAIRRGIYLPMKADDLKREILIWIRNRVRPDMGSVELLVFGLMRQFLNRRKMLKFYFKQEYLHLASGIRLNMAIRRRDIKKANERRRAPEYYYEDEDDHHDDHDHDHDHGHGHKEEQKSH